MYVKWEPPQVQQGTFKLNTDGALRKSEGLAGLEESFVMPTVTE